MIYMACNTVFLLLISFLLAVEGSVALVPVLTMMVASFAETVSLFLRRPQRWRHRKRGTTYRLLCESAMVQTSTPLKDYDSVAVYVDEKTENYCVRPTSEFRDGRFERI